MKFFEVDAFVIMVNDFGCRASETIIGSHFPALEFCLGMRAYMSVNMFCIMWR